MNIQLRQLFDIVGECADIDYSIDVNELKDINAYSFASPISIKGKIVNRAGIVKLTYDCRAELELECDRCLASFRREYCYSFEHIIVRETQSDDDEYVVCNNNELDLNELAVSDLLLQLPTRILCKDDCKGLCFTCGHDLNEGDCDCVRES